MATNKCQRGKNFQQEIIYQANIHLSTIMFCWQLLYQDYVICVGHVSLSTTKVSQFYEQIKELQQCLNNILSILYFQLVIVSLTGEKKSLASSNKDILVRQIEEFTVDQHPQYIVKWVHSSRQCSLIHISTYQHCSPSPTIDHIELLKHLER